MRPIDADAVLKRIDTEREVLVKVGMLGAEHTVTHYVRNFIEDAPTIYDATLDVFREASEQEEGVLLRVGNKTYKITEVKE